jgi:hypothetical protein
MGQVMPYSPQAAKEYHKKERDTKTYPSQSCITESTSSYKQILM